MPYPTRSEILAKFVEAVEKTYGIKPPMSYTPGEYSSVTYRVIRQKDGHRDEQSVEVKLQPPDEYTYTANIYLVSCYDRFNRPTYRRNLVGTGEYFGGEMRSLHRDGLAKIFEKHLPKFKELYDDMVKRATWKSEAKAKEAAQLTDLTTLAHQITTEMGWEDPKIWDWRNEAELRTREGKSLTLTPGKTPGTVTLEGGFFEDLYPREMVYLVKSVQAMKAER